MARLAAESGFRIVASLGYHILPPRLEVEWRTRKRSELSKKLAKPLGAASDFLGRFEGLRRRLGRLRFLALERAV